MNDEQRDRIVINLREIVTGTTVLSKKRAYSILPDSYRLYVLYCIAGNSREFQDMHVVLTMRTNRMTVDNAMILFVH